MNKNILSPKGTINQSLFIVYYLVLMTIYIIGGLSIIIFVYKHNLNSLYFLLPFLLIKLLIAFNYKKRFLEISGNLVLSIVLAIILTFDTAILPVCQLIKDAETSLITFFALGIFILFIQPAIVALIPAKSQNNEFTD